MDIPNEAFIMKSKKIIKFIPKSKLINYEPKLWNTKFTHIENIQKLQLTDVGVYSIATPIISDSMLKFIQEISTLYSLKSFFFSFLPYLSIYLLHTNLYIFHNISQFYHIKTYDLDSF